jgi:hypothetical protein
MSFLPCNHPRRELTSKVTGFPIDVAPQEVFNLLSVSSRLSRMAWPKLICRASPRSRHWSLHSRIDETT